MAKALSIPKAAREAERALIRVNRNRALKVTFGGKDDKPVYVTFLADKSETGYDVVTKSASGGAPSTEHLDHEAAVKRLSGYYTDPDASAKFL
jgi:hypothetical protein